MDAANRVLPSGDVGRERKASNRWPPRFNSTVLFVFPPLYRLKNNQKVTGSGVATSFPSVPKYFKVDRKADNYNLEISKCWLIRLGVPKRSGALDAIQVMNESSVCPSSQVKSNSALVHPNVNEVLPRSNRNHEEYLGETPTHQYSYR